MKLKRECMSDRLKQVLLERILDGTYQPGDRLVELQIAREMETSQAPVREALYELAAMGLVESEAYRGTRVRQVSAEELQESYQVRAILEEMAAQLAAPKFYKNPLPLQTAHAAVQAAAQTGDVDAHAKLDAAFHRLIVETSGNSVLLRVWDSLSFETWTRINLMLIKSKTVDLQSLIEEHQQIVDAFMLCDGKTAGRLLHQHLEAAIKIA
ncbi:MAG: GntR family transcriptional regulator [Rhizonema sp. PD37]|nr:GntR family transcriptional regulator [Rhizonema sp. PD37]